MNNVFLDIARKNRIEKCDLFEPIVRIEKL